ncbi:uncharacterized protein SETTUDRAFT_39654 [Exserohilum turcica Et28A]|uniref:Uncharacterized protein n=1 Tax=Exserohilum turcicum (strain 28A) TaxID=671987 RepID=R0KDD8_EXST2|nr:uncharacterized protein SETTUDRAFT_39654 [Exserohilum turcica Et28A]EOA86157.1 hypothetical protein SETTUDRAFT_39654 [Exserohilum turcica Et28A]
MKAFASLTALSLIGTCLAIPCVTQVSYYTPQHPYPDEREPFLVCWDTQTKTCKATMKSLLAKPGANIINTCSNVDGVIKWHVGTGWTVFGVDLESFDMQVDVSTTDCTVNAYHSIFVKYFGLPLAVLRTDDKPAAVSSACPF